MVFTSLEFIFIFFPIVLLMFYICWRLESKRAAIFILTLASLIFYGWWKWEYILLLFVSILINFSIGSILFKYRMLWLLILGISINIFILGYFKYMDFMIESVNIALDTSIPLWGIALPLAISFYTFQQIAFLIDKALSFNLNNFP